MSNKENFINRYLPNTISKLEITKIDLDSTDLSISDILRNINELYRPNTHDRNAIRDGKLAIGVSCMTKTISPYSGVFLLVTKKGMDINVTSSKYIVLTISEDRITNDIKIQEIIEDLTKYLASVFRHEMHNLPDFYRKFIYDPTELEIYE